MNNPLSFSDPTGLYKCVPLGIVPCDTPPCYMCGGAGGGGGGGGGGYGGDAGPGGPSGGPGPPTFGWYYGGGAAGGGLPCDSDYLPCGMPVPGGWPAQARFWLEWGSSSAAETIHFRSILRTMFTTARSSNWLTVLVSLFTPLNCAKTS